MQKLTDSELLHYDRQITLKGFDIDKQTRLKNQSALIIGVGGLGCSASLYLCSSGIGKITLVDFDSVSKSNLNRQILYTQADLNQKKVFVAKKKLYEHNPNIIINAVDSLLDKESLLNLINQHDIILDCTDNVQTRKQINECCFSENKTLVSAAAIRMEGLVSVFTYQNDEPCYQCLTQFFNDEQITCVESGVMSPLVGIVGSIQAIEAIKSLTQYGKTLTNRMLMIDAMTMEFNEIQLPKLPNCPVCGQEP